MLSLEKVKNGLETICSDLAITGLTCFLFTAIGTLQTIYSFRGVK